MSASKSSRRYGLRPKKPAVTPLPTAYNAAVAAFKDADQWWTAQGSPPPPLNLQVASAGEDGAYAQYHAGNVTIDPQTLSSWDKYLHGKTSRQAKLKTLAMIWGMAAHERGHNIGYPHGVSPLMQDGIGALPGRAYEWATSVLGPARKK